MEHLEHFAYLIALCFLGNMLLLFINGFVWIYFRYLQKKSNKFAVFLIDKYGMSEAKRLVREWKSHKTLTLKSKEENQNA